MLMNYLYPKCNALYLFYCDARSKIIMPSVLQIRKKPWIFTGNPIRNIQTGNWAAAHQKKQMSVGCAKRLLKNMLGSESIGENLWAGSRSSQNYKERLNWYRRSGSVYCWQDPGFWERSGYNFKSSNLATDNPLLHQDLAECARISLIKPFSFNQLSNPL